MCPITKTNRNNCCIPLFLSRVQLDNTLGMRIILLSTLLLFSSLLVGQNPRKGETKTFLVGSILDADTDQPLAYATASYYSVADSALKGGAITDDQGKYALEAAPGEYLIKLEFMGYQSQWIGPYSVTKEERFTRVSPVKLAVNSITLKAAEVKAEKSQVAMALDKKTFNVGDDLSSIGGSATDVLENVPSVTVDGEGNVSLRGSGNVRILINGKQSGLVGISSQDALQMLPADMIERVEVITNPSARYDAEGMSGIINIVLKEEQEIGTKGVFTVTGGFPTNANASVNLSHNLKNWGFSAGYSNRYRDYGGYSSEDRRTAFGDSIVNLDQYEDNNRNQLGHNFRAGIELRQKRNTFSLNGNYRFAESDNDTKVDYTTTTDAGGYLARFHRNNSEFEDEFSYDVSLDFDRKFTEKGRKLTATINANISEETEDTDAQTDYFGGAGFNSITSSLIQHSLNKEAQTNGVAQVDYVHPLAGKQNLELGYKSSLRIIKSDYFVEELNPVTNDFETLQGVTNQFDYTEGIHAAYANYSNQWDKFGIMAGVRVEYSDILTEQITTGEKNKRDYVDPFPSVFLSYKFDQVKSMQLSYSRRIRRPGFWNLNPFFNYNNPLSFRSGNPNLDPEYTNSMEWTYLMFQEKWSLNASLYYRHSYNVIQWVQTIVDSVTYTAPQNVNEQHSYGIELTGSYKPISWWRLNGTFNFFGSELDARDIENGRQVSFASWTAQLSSMMQFTNLFNLQIRANYNAPTEQAQGTRKYLATMNLAITKNIWKDRATISFKVNDVFNSRIRRFESFGNNFQIEGERQWRPRTVILGFTYRLNMTEREARMQEGGSFGDGGE